MTHPVPLVSRPHDMWFTLSHSLPGPSLPSGPSWGVNGVNHMGSGEWGTIEPFHPTVHSLRSTEGSGLISLMYRGLRRRRARGEWVERGPVHFTLLATLPHGPVSLFIRARSVTVRSGEGSDEGKRDRALTSLRSARSLISHPVSEASVTSWPGRVTMNNGRPKRERSEWDPPHPRSTRLTSVHRV